MAKNADKKKTAAGKPAAAAAPKVEKRKRADPDAKVDEDVAARVGTKNNYTHPRELVYKHKDIAPGTSFRLRFLSMHPDYIAEIKVREAAGVWKNVEKIGKQGKEKVTWETKTIIVPDMGKDNSKFTDMEGKTLDMCQMNTLVRYPVWVYSARTKASNGAGSVSDEPINKVMFITLNKAMVRSLNEMRNQGEGQFEFDEQTKRPEYIVDLKVVPVDTRYKKNYEFEGVEKIRVKVKDKTTGKSTMKLKDDPFFGKPPKVALEKFWDEHIDPELDEVCDAMFWDVSEEYVRMQLTPPEGFVIPGTEGKKKSKKQAKSEEAEEEDDDLLDDEDADDDDAEDSDDDSDDDDESDDDDDSDDESEDDDDSDDDDESDDDDDSDDADDDSDDDDDDDDDSDDEEEETPPAKKSGTKKPAAASKKPAPAAKGKQSARKLK